MTERGKICLALALAARSAHIVRPVTAEELFASMTGDSGIINLEDNEATELEELEQGDRASDAPNASETTSEFRDAAISIGMVPLPVTNSVLADPANGGDKEIEIDFFDKDPNYCPLNDNDRNSTDSEEESEATNYAQPQAENLVENLSNAPNGDMPSTSDDTGPQSKRRRKSQPYAESHPLGKPCGPKCKKNCTVKIIEFRRQLIWKDFTSKVYNERKKFLFDYVKRGPKQRSTTRESTSSRRQMTFKYHLPDGHHEHQQVCKHFFLTTLGFNSKNDKAVTTIMTTTEESSISPTTDKRGKYIRRNKLDMTMIKSHIESFNPTISHYRRAHAPKRRYLPSDSMHEGNSDNFFEKYPEHTCSYETYRSVVKEMRISFTKLGEEECETCLKFNATTHDHDKVPDKAQDKDRATQNTCIDSASGTPQHAAAQSENQSNGEIVCNMDNNEDISTLVVHGTAAQIEDSSISADRAENIQLEYPTNEGNTQNQEKITTACSLCEEFQQHKKMAKKAREHYQHDAERNESDVAIRSVDLQKVIMLPRMPGCKSACFTKRIIVFHLTFAYVGKGRGKRNISVLWHEGIAGRKCEEIASAYVKVLLQERDFKHVILWADNCSAQNKNWALFTTLSTFVNLPNNEMEDITVKYFEAGHSFMSADSVHHGVEMEMARQPKGNVFDYQHFEQVVRASNGGRMDVICIQNSDMRNWRARQSQAKLKKPGRPMLNTVCIVQFRRNSRMMYYKCNYDDDEYQEFDFLVNRYVYELPPLYREAERGIPEKKKQDIINVLVPMMPQSRREFWKSMPTGTVPDLISEDQGDE